jgi:hypothetical protein
MDDLKAEIRGDRGARRKQKLRVARYIKNKWLQLYEPTRRELGKLVKTRKQCSCAVCKSGDHAKSVSSQKADACMASQLGEISTAQ